MKKKTQFYCKKCLSTDVEMRGFINLNTGERDEISWEAEDEFWCSECIEWHNVVESLGERDLEN